MFEWIHASPLWFDRWTLMMETVLHFTTRSKESIMFTRQCITWFPVRGLLLLFFFYLNLHADSVQSKLAQSHDVYVIRITTDVPHISRAPVLMMRPRAWNMVEHNMMVQTSPWKYHQCFVFLLFLLCKSYSGINRLCVNFIHSRWNILVRVWYNAIIIGQITW